MSARGTLKKFGPQSSGKVFTFENNIILSIILQYYTYNLAYIIYMAHINFPYWLCLMWKSFDSRSPPSPHVSLGSWKWKSANLVTISDDSYCWKWNPAVKSNRPKPTRKQCFFGITSLSRVESEDPLPPVTVIITVLFWQYVCHGFWSDLSFIFMKHSCLIGASLRL